MAPAELHKSQVEFLHLYLVCEERDGKIYMSLVRVDEPNEKFLSAEMKTVWGKVDRSILTDPIYAPLPAYFGVQGRTAMEEQLIIRYNNKQTPEGWLSLGAKYGKVICPSLSELKGTVLEVMGAHAHLVGHCPCRHAHMRLCACRGRHGQGAVRGAGRTSQGDRAREERREGARGSLFLVQRQHRGGGGGG